MKVFQIGLIESDGGRKFCRAEKVHSRRREVHRRPSGANRNLGLHSLRVPVFYFPIKILREKDFLNQKDFLTTCRLQYEEQMKPRN